ncbi:hypothetical protein BZG72_15700 [Salinivibrio sp. PR6]|uniref:hypothetical protein n=1 Tax=Salinivibrio sp. PR6 TaxID=1909485 RepID=UPI000988A5BF|nr:hypothetical protein [Salinivibrio sp. PR6]OOE78234.1 hypothetical protein BZG72_15700 [Salinivibrio sp. PR6]
MITVDESTESIWVKAKAKLALNPSTGLENQWLFWLAVLTPLSLALALALPVWLEYSLSFSAKGYGTFLKISALPIGISSLSIPLGVLIGRLHGTKQTALQISEAQATNRTNLYLAHYEHFCDHLATKINALLFLRVVRL